jgi:DNA-binding transcriptional MerR regulator
MSEAVGFGGPEVCKIVGISYRQLDYWDRTGLLHPSLAPARGSGSKRRYSYRDVLELRLIKRLLDGGLELREARRAIGCLREVGEDLAQANLVLGPAGSVLVRSGEELVDVLRGGQGVFNIVPLAPVVGEVDAAILELSGARRDARGDGARRGRGRSVTVREGGGDRESGVAAGGPG